MQGGSGATPTYTVFVAFRRGRLALRRRLPTLALAIACAKGLRAERRRDRDGLFVVCDATGERFELDHAEQAIEDEEQASFADREAGARHRLGATAVRARIARERAIVALERARTVFARTDAAFARSHTVDAQPLEELLVRAADGMLRAIELVEARTSRYPAPPATVPVSGAPERAGGAPT
jgi:hypothetical protein